MDNKTLKSILFVLGGLALIFIISTACQIDSKDVVDKRCKSSGMTNCALIDLCPKNGNGWEFDVYNGGCVWCGSDPVTLPMPPGCQRLYDNGNNNAAAAGVYNNIIR